MGKNSKIILGVIVVLAAVGGYWFYGGNGGGKDIIGGGGQTFRWAFQGDSQAVDPHSLNETFTLGFLGNVYEGLVRRNADLQIEPALAESWSIVEPTRWRFKLRRGVKFHNGNDFNADDVVFSATRVRAEGSDLQVRISKKTRVVKVDDYTVDFITPNPDPILHYEWDTWFIMDKEWCEENNAVNPTSVTEGKDNYAAFNSNGTGPFMIVSRETDVKTVLVPNPEWWDEAGHNLGEVIMTPIPVDATRVATLLSGEIDMVYPVPVQDIQRVNANAETRVLTGPELRTVFLGFDQRRDELLESSVAGKNPFKDIRVRKAFYQAIDIEAIKKVVMRDLATPSALMISPLMFDLSDGYQRLPYDIGSAKAMLADAGYPNGFEVGMDCPNNRYVNDEQICLSVVNMLAKVGITVNLLAQPKAQYFSKVLKPRNETTFYMLGWTPGSFDSWNVLNHLHGCDDGSGRGKFNLGNYCNPRVDALTDQILVETDKPKRDKLIADAFNITLADVAYIPLHQQGLAWGVSNNVELVQRADNQFHLKYVTKK